LDSLGSSSFQRKNTVWGARGGHEAIAEVQKSIEAVGEVDIRDALETIDFAEFGDAEDQKALRKVLMEYRDVFRPTNSVMRGSDFSIKVRNGADIRRLNRVTFRKSTLEKKVEEVEMKSCRGAVSSNHPYRPVARQMSLFLRRPCRTEHLEFYG
jgi:hypothetical protein